MQHLAAAFEVHAQLADALLDRDIERAQGGGAEHAVRLEPVAALGALQGGFQRRVVEVFGGAGCGP